MSPSARGQGRRKGFARRCYCDFEPAVIDALARRRFGEGVPTLSLVAGAGDPLTKEAAALVGLLDLPEPDLAEVASEAARRRHLVACRLRVLTRLRRQGIEVVPPP